MENYTRHGRGRPRQPGKFCINNLNTPNYLPKNRIFANCTNTENNNNK